MSLQKIQDAKLKLYNIIRKEEWFRGISSGPNNESIIVKISNLNYSNKVPSEIDGIPVDLI